MNTVARIISYLFHPLLMPLAGSIAYFSVSPEYHGRGEAWSVLIPITILTVIIPVVALLIFKNLGILEGNFLKQPLKKHALLLLGISMGILVLLRILYGGYYTPLYFYFVGLIGAYTAALLALFLQAPANLHMMGLGSLLMFLVTLSIHFETNITFAIAVCTLVCGFSATVILHRSQPRPVHLVIGFFLGLLTQLLTLKFWL